MTPVKLGSICFSLLIGELRNIAQSCPSILSKFGFTDEHGEYDAILMSMMVRFWLKWHLGFS